MNMECPYWGISMAKRFCGASATLTAPSTEDADEYCKTEEHYRCPMLLGHLLRGGDAGLANRMSNVSIA